MTLTALARSCAQLGDDPAAEAYADRARQLEQNDAAARAGALRLDDPLRLEVEDLAVSSTLARERGLRRIATGDLAGAIDALEIVEEAEPDDVAVHVRLARAHLGLGRHQDATRHLDRALELDPDDAVAHYLYGGLLASNGRFESALPHFQHARAANPDLHDIDGFVVRTLVELGGRLEREGKLIEAMARYREALEIDPDHAIRARLETLEER